VHRVAGVAVLVSALSVVTAGGQQSQPPPSTFRAGKTLSLMDVAVTDRRGRFIGDLSAPDFELTRDGRPVPVEALYRIVRSQVVTVPAAEPTSAEAAAFVPARTFILFFDSRIGLAPLDRAKAAAQAFLRREMRPDDYAGIVYGGAGRLVQGRLIRVPEEAAAAVAGVRPDPNALGEVLTPTPRAPASSGETPSRASGAGDEINAELARADQMIGDGGAGWERVASLAQLFAVVNGMRDLPGRKAILFLSDGVPLGGIMPGDKQGTGYFTLRKIVEAADEAGVRIYSVDTAGLNKGFASSKILTAEGAREPGASVYQDEVPASPRTPKISGDDAMSSLALDTGGLWIHNENNFGDAFTRIAADNGSYYVLGYDASGLPDSASVKVRVKRSNVTVRARRALPTR